MPEGIDDKNIWSFLKTITEQNEKIYGNMAEISEQNKALEKRADELKQNILVEVAWKQAEFLTKITGVGADMTRKQWIESDPTVKA